MTQVGHYKSQGFLKRGHSICHRFFRSACAWKSLFHRRVVVKCFICIPICFTNHLSPTSHRMARKDYFRRLKLTNWSRPSMNFMRPQSREFECFCQRPDALEGLLSRRPQTTRLNSPLRRGTLSHSQHRERLDDARFAKKSGD